MKLMTIVGARPQFIKEAALQGEFKNHENIDEILVHTGQHYDINMSDVFFDKLSINAPKYNLGISSNLHGEMTGKMMVDLEKIVLQEKPDMVLVYGDTNSTLAGALVASKLKIQTVHIEAGNRIKNPYMPEEINRIVTDHVSDYLFCESENDIQNLENEGIHDNVFLSGDVMYDIFLKMENKFDYSIQKKYKLLNKEYIVMTLHRDFNVDNKEKFEHILNSINKIAKEIPVIYPVHPRAKKRIEDFGIQKSASNILLIEPINYLQLMGLTKNCFKAITDSGGFQKETYYAGKQALLLMPEPGAVELEKMGWNQLVTAETLFETALNSIEISIPNGIYGNGKASEIIVETILEKYS
jgi:UDP-GlcNAc3NAcA epimerase